MQPSPLSISWVKELERSRAMLQNFQCTSCGHLNTFGEPACTQCGQQFIYNCPICGSHINNRYNKCRGCGTAFNWGVPVQQTQSNTAATFPQEQLNVYPQNQEQNTPSLMLPSAAAQQPPTAVGQVRKPFQPSNVNTTSLFSTPRFWIILIIICAVLIALLLVIDRFISK